MMFVYNYEDDYAHEDDADDDDDYVC
jgi:hypothetical protein